MPHFHGATQLVIIALFVIAFTGALRMLAMSFPDSRISKSFIALNG